MFGECFCGETDVHACEDGGVSEEVGGRDGVEQDFYGGHAEGVGEPAARGVIHRLDPGTGGVGGAQESCECEQEGERGFVAGERRYGEPVTVYGWPDQEAGSEGVYRARRHHP